jgi:hypothetical protein
VVITPTIEGIGGQKGAIIGSFENSSLQNLYFYGGNCNIAIGIGDYISTVCRARKVTLGSGIGSVSSDANSMDNGFVYNNERYYREKLTLTLTTNLSEKSGYHIVYKVDGKNLDGNTYTVNSTDGDVTLTAEYTPDIHYIDADGNRQTSSDYTVLTNATNISNLSAGWYVVESNVSYSSDFYCESGDIHLILCDNAKMTVKTTSDAMYEGKGNLTIYAQSTGNSMGQLEATSSTELPSTPILTSPSVVVKLLLLVVVRAIIFLASTPVATSPSTADRSAPRASMVSEPTMETSPSACAMPTTISPPTDTTPPEVLSALPTARR